MSTKGAFESTRITAARSRAVGCRGASLWARLRELCPKDHLYDSSGSAARDPKLNASPPDTGAIRAGSSCGVRARMDFLDSGTAEAMSNLPPVASWPPSDEDLAWRPATYTLRDSIEVGDEELPALTLAQVLLESTLSDVVTVHAVADSEGSYRIIVRDEYETRFTPPIVRATEPLTLGELLRVLDETTRSDEPDWKGITNAYREYNATEGVPRGELAHFVTVQSEVYPQLEELERRRGEEWARGS